jgi:hypothetical protein
MRDAAGKGRHVVAAIVDSDDQLVFTETIADAAEIGTPLPAIAVHLVAIDASFIEEHLGAVTDGRISGNWNRIRDGLRRRS